MSKEERQEKQGTQVVSLPLCPRCGSRMRIHGTGESPGKVRITVMCTGQFSAGTVQGRDFSVNASVMEMRVGGEKVEVEPPTCDVGSTLYISRYSNERPQEALVRDLRATYRETSFSGRDE